MLGIRATTSETGRSFLGELTRFPSKDLVRRAMLQDLAAENLYVRSLIIGRLDEFHGPSGGVSSPGKVIYGSFSKVIHDPTRSAPGPVESPSSPSQRGMMWIPREWRSKACSSGPPGSWTGVLFRIPTQIDPTSPGVEIVSNFTIRLASLWIICFPSVGIRVFCQPRLNAWFAAIWLPLFLRRRSGSGCRCFGEE